MVPQWGHCDSCLESTDVAGVVSRRRCEGSSFLLAERRRIPHRGLRGVTIRAVLLEFSIKLHF
jgi:hypothetical protein